MQSVPIDPGAKIVKLRVQGGTAGGALQAGTVRVMTRGGL
jgi:hypothetical protein